MKVNGKQEQLANPERIFPSFFWKIGWKKKTKSLWLPSLAARVVRPTVIPLIKAHGYLQSIGVTITLVKTPNDQRKPWRSGKASKQRAAFQMNAIARACIVKCLDFRTLKQISLRQQKIQIRYKELILTH